VPTHLWRLGPPKPLLPSCPRPLPAGPARPRPPLPPIVFPLQGATEPWLLESVVDTGGYSVIVVVVVVVVVDVRACAVVVAARRSKSGAQQVKS